MKRHLVLMGCIFGTLFASATSLHADPLNSIAKHLAKAMAKTDNKKVAVLPFPYHDGSLSSGSSIVSERLTNDLAERPEVQVIERSLLSKVMGEMKLEDSGAVDPASIQKVGNILGVGAIVTGTLIDLDDGKTEVNARLIQTQSGVVLAAATERVTRTWTDLPRPAAPQGGALSQPAVQSPVSPPADNEDVLTLTNKDLEHSEKMPDSADQFVTSIMNNSANVPTHPFAILRRIYNRNPDRRIRATALLDIGILLERRNRPALAARAYHQLLREFPGQSRLDETASSRLQALGL